MKMQRKHAVLFLAIAAWNVFTYATFTKNLAAAHAQGEDRPAGYWIAHSVLIVVNLVIAGVLGAPRGPGLARHRGPGTDRRMRRHLPATAAAVVATAVAGGIGTDVGSRWYERLDKPRWQPPGWAFGPAWTTLYALVAVSSARVLDRAEPEDRTAFATALGANLVLNTGWTWVFFTARKPRWALLEILVLEASTLDLARRARRVDPTAAALLAPYAGWVGFATALTASIARRNPSA